MEFLVQPVDDRSDPSNDAVAAPSKKYFALSVLPEWMAAYVQQQPLFADKRQDRSMIVLVEGPPQIMEVAPVAGRSNRPDSATIHHTLS
jgi:hypothetical protein